MSLRGMLAGGGGGGGQVIHATGYVNATATGTGTSNGEDGRYLDITVPAVPDINKVKVEFVGNSSSASPYMGSVYYSGTADVSRMVLYRMTSPTNLRLSLNGSSAADRNTIIGRYTVYDLS